MKKIYINLTENTKCFFQLIWNNFDDKENLIDSINNAINKKFDLDENLDIYIFYNKILKHNKKLLIKKNNVNFIFTDNFAYSMKQLSWNIKMSKKDILLTNSIWDYYLFDYLEVYSMEYTVLNCNLIKVDLNMIWKKFPDVKIKHLNDYIILQTKNIDDSIWHKKTLYYLNKFDWIKKLLNNLDKIKEEKYKDAFVYQRERLNFYLTLKDLFLTKKDFN